MRTAGLNGACYLFGYTKILSQHMKSPTIMLESCGPYVHSSESGGRSTCKKLLPTQATHYSALHLLFKAMSSHSVCTPASSDEPQHLGRNKNDRHNINCACANRARTRAIIQSSAIIPVELYTRPPLTTLLTRSQQHYLPMQKNER